MVPESRLQVDSNFRCFIYLKYPSKLISEAGDKICIIGFINSPHYFCQPKSHSGLMKELVKITTGCSYFVVNTNITED